MNYWLLKSEPYVWSIDDQVKAGDNGIAWAGIQRFKKNMTDDFNISAKSRWPLDGDAPYMKGPGLKLL